MRPSILRHTAAFNCVLLACCLLSGCGDAESRAPAPSTEAFLPAESHDAAEPRDTNVAAAVDSEPDANVATSPTGDLPQKREPELPASRGSDPFAAPAAERDAEPAIAEDVAWTEDFEAAKALAREDGRDILMDFTGSDWCGWCIRLDNEVFQFAKFADYADKNFVLVKLDYPRDRSRMTEATQAQNAELQARFAIQGYPTILLADAKGRPYAQTGYQQGGPDVYVQHLEELKQVRVARDEALAQADNLSGVERAKQLNDALEMLQPNLVLPSYEALIEEIVELDADNEAGLQQPLKQRLLASRFQTEMIAIQQHAESSKDADSTLQKLDEVEKQFADYEAGQTPLKLLRLELLKLGGKVDELVLLADSVLEDSRLPQQQRFNVYAAKLNAFVVADRLEEALEVIANLLEQFPGQSRLSTQLLLNKADFLVRLGRPAEGREALAKAREVADPRALEVLKQAEAQLFPEENPEAKPAE